LIFIKKGQFTKGRK